MAISKVMQQKLDEAQKKKAEPDNELLKRIERLEFVVRKIAHFSGNNRILLEAGFDPWFPGQDDMRKYKG